MQSRLTLMDLPEFHVLAANWAEDIYGTFPRTTEGGLEHFTTGDDKLSLNRNHQQLSADTVFMTNLFLAKTARMNNHEEWGEEAAYQLLLHIKYLLDNKTMLFSHGWDFDKRDNFGKTFWCRGNSWMAYGIPLYLEIMQGKLPDAVSRYLIEVYQNQIQALFSLQSTDHLWHTVLDDSESYVESSGSAGIIAGTFLGLHMGILPKEFTGNAQQSIRSLMGKVDDRGIVTDVSAGTPISANRETYKHIRKLPIVYGQALTICAFAEYLNFSHSEKHV